MIGSTMTVSSLYGGVITVSTLFGSTPNNVFTQGNGIAGNPRIGAVVCDSQVALSDSLDIVSDTYYNTGYTNFSASIQSQTYN